MDVERHVGSGPFIPAVDEEAPGGMVINPHTALGKELRKWEQHRTELVPRGTNPGNPYVFRPYPKMLYRAQQAPNGKYACILPMPHPYGFEKQELYQQACLMVESFNKTCCRIVADEGQESIAKGQGWAEGPQEATELHEKEQQAIGNAAAEAAFMAQRMTAKAREELAAADATTHQHVTDVRGTRKGARAVTAVEEE